MVLGLPTKTLSRTSSVVAFFFDKANNKDCDNQKTRVSFTGSQAGVMYLSCIDRVNHKTNMTSPPAHGFELVRVRSRPEKRKRNDEPPPSRSNKKQKPNETTKKRNNDADNDDDDDSMMTIPLPQMERLRVGSKAGVNDACLKDPNGYISRAHAIFGPMFTSDGGGGGGGGHYVLDRRSTNGTFVNRERLLVRHG